MKNLSTIKRKKNKPAGIYIRKQFIFSVAAGEFLGGILLQRVFHRKPITDFTAAEIQSYNMAHFKNNTLLIFINNRETIST